MMECPACDSQNIEGSDTCVECGMPLSDLHLSAPATEVERALIRDRLTVLKPRAPIVVPQSMTVGDVIGFLVDRKIGCVFIVDESESIVGVFTERDAYRKIGADIDAVYDAPISELMTREPKGLQSDAKVAFALRMMDQEGYRHILTLDEHGSPVGVASVRDILHYLTSIVQATD